MKRETYILRTLTYVGERSIYGTKLVNMCQGSKARKLEKIYTVQFRQLL